MNGWEFRYQWAIRMPNGHLYTEPVKAKQETNAYDPLGLSAMFNLWMPSEPTPESPNVLRPKIFDTEADASKLLTELQERATQVGIPNWAGCVVRSLCTPFTSADPAKQFVKAIAVYLQQETD